jgi:DNA-binding Xre family transcriptional regulator
MASFRALLDELALRRTLRAAELQAALGVSQPTLSRLVRAAGGDVLRMGRARAVRYARTRRVAGLGGRLPIFAVGGDGRPRPRGALHLLWGGQHFWAQGERGRLFEGLPPELADMAPQGWLGHAFAAHHPELSLPPRLSSWSDDDRLVALARRGEDCVGDLVVGDESLQRYLSWTPRPVAAASYPALALRSARDAPGSSAGGERPKFLAFTRGRHVLVKFAPAGGGAAGRRWRDLLACEAHALATVTRAGVPAARARLVDVRGWRFLEVDRFDRVGERGRRGVLTLGALDDEHFGKRDRWTAAAARLEASPFSLPPGDAARLRWLDAFGQLIGNTDRHFGNVAFFTAPGGALRLAPAYDMLPMALAPAGEAVVERPFQPAPPSGGDLAEWPGAAAWAARYWADLAQAPRLSLDVRAFARAAAADVAALARRVAVSWEPAPERTRRGRGGGRAARTAR